MSAEVRRESDEARVCMCRLICGSEVNDCPGQTTPDSPFCRGCEDRHPAWARDRVLVVTTKPLPVGGAQ